MSQNNPRRPPSPGAAPGAPRQADRTSVLRDVLDHAVRAERENARPAQPRDRRSRTALAIAFVAPALAFALYSFVGRPAFLWGERPQVSPVVVESSLRLSMALLGTQIEDFRARHGELPETLAAFGQEGGPVRYHAADDSTWVLTATEAGRTLTLTRGDDMERFVGTALTVLRGRAR